MFILSQEGDMQKDDVSIEHGIGLINNIILWTFLVGSDIMLYYSQSMRMRWSMIMDPSAILNAHAGSFRIYVKRFLDTAERTAQNWQNKFSDFMKKAILVFWYVFHLELDSVLDCTNLVVL